MKKFKFIILTLSLLLFLYSNLLISNAQTEENLPLDCVICPQFVPECGPNEVLIPQTCDKCSYCESFTPPKTQITPQPEIINIIPESTPASEKTANCQSCQFHAQCPARSKCINGCCEVKPRKQRKYTNVKKTECIICSQVLLTCKLNEKLIKQTCTKCAYCEKIKPQLVVKKELPKPTSQTKTESLQKKECKMPCGTKCCKSNESCITLSQCKGKKPCHLPLLRICTKKKPEPLSGGAISF